MRNKRKNEEKKDEIVEKLYVVGPTETAKIMGWKHRSSFYKHFHEGHLIDIRSVLMLKGRYYVLEDVFKEAYPEADESRLKKMITDYRVKNRQKVKAIYLSKDQTQEVSSQMITDDFRFLKDVVELSKNDPNGSVRIYKMAPDGVKLKFKQEISLSDAHFAAKGNGIDSFIQESLGSGDYLVKLLSTKYGRNLVIGKYRFYV